MVKRILKITPDTTTFLASNADTWLIVCYEETIFSTKKVTLNDISISTEIRKAKYLSANLDRIKEQIESGNVPGQIHVEERLESNLNMLGDKKISEYDRFIKKNKFGVILRHNDEVIYRFEEYDETANLSDVIIEHDNTTDPVFEEKIYSTMDLYSFNLFAKQLHPDEYSEILLRLKRDSDIDMKKASMQLSKIAEFGNYGYSLHSGFHEYAKEKIESVAVKSFTESVQIEKTKPLVSVLENMTKNKVLESTTNKDSKLSNIIMGTLIYGFIGVIVLWNAYVIIGGVIQTLHEMLELVFPTIVILCIIGVFIFIRSGISHK